MDADHLDIYGDSAHIHEAFKAFSAQVSGTVITKYGLDITEQDTKANILRYSFDDPRADFHANEISIDRCGYFTFTLVWPGGSIPGCKVGIPGWVNVENAVAASAIALTYGLDPEKVKAALAAFEGVKRRFDIHLNTPECSYIDDYAHHPKEISTAISSMRDIFPGRKLTAVFQPHLYTRTRDFADEFAESLSKADKLILLDIYPARELPIEGVTSEIIFKDVTVGNKVLLKKEEALEYLRGRDIDIMVTFGAGDIDRLIVPIEEMLKERIK
jgi:UDP-N-acetylmuramate--alanine ligase